MGGDPKFLCGANVFDDIIDIEAVVWRGGGFLEGGAVDRLFRFCGADFIGEDQMVEEGKELHVLRDKVDVGGVGIRKDEELIPFYLKGFDEGFHLFTRGKNV